jgi:N-acetylmuramic acid 6-phosphate etherase
MAEELAALATEQENERTRHLDMMSAGELVGAMHEADREAVEAVGRVAGEVARAVEGIAERLRSGGRLFYVGAGTSGRLGVLDASECPPTFGTDPGMVVGVIAGGDVALRNAVERAEDHEQAGERDLLERGLNEKDVLVGIAASGRTPYVLGALRYARRKGAWTVAVSCVRGSEVGRLAEVAIEPETGPEVVTGSTRLKAGTATKLVLNMLSTGAMVKLGYVYGNLMVNVQPTNAKLRDRGARLVMRLTGAGPDEARRLMDTGGSVRAAVVMGRLGVGRAEAESRLAEAGWRLREALGGSTLG